MAGFLMLKVLLMVTSALTAGGLLTSIAYSQKRKGVHKGSLVMVPDGREGKIVEIVKYEDMTLYGVRLGHQIQHYQRDQLNKRS